MSFFCTYKGAGYSINGLTGLWWPLQVVDIFQYSIANSKLETQRRNTPIVCFPVPDYFYAPWQRPVSQVLATNHVFDILVKAMGSDGDLQKIEEKALPPRKRPGWTGGDDRGPSSKPIPKRTQCAGSEGGVEKGSSAEDKTAEDVACSTETTGKESRCACEDGKVCKDARVSCTKKSQRSNSFTKEMSAVVATSVDAVVESGEKAVETDVVKRTKRDESTVGSLEAKRAKTASGENVA